jgi:hypothetical protein
MNSSPTTAARQGRTRILTKAQTKGLQAAHKDHPIPERTAWNESKALADWVRPGYEIACPQLKGSELMSAVLFQGFRRAKPWTSSDEMIVDDLAARSFGVDYLARRRSESRPAWLRKIVEALHDGEKLPQKAGYFDFIADLVRAKRVGAVSAFMSHLEAGELYKCSERTFRRWMQTAEDLGIVSMVQTWKRNNGVRRCAFRRWGKIAYVAGPALMGLAGAAVWEGIPAEQLRGGSRTVTAARRRAQELRAECLNDLRARKDQAWRARYGKPAASPLSPDIMSDPPSPKGSEIGEQQELQGEERPEAAVSSAPPTRDEKPHAATRGAASPETNANRPNPAGPPTASGPDRLASTAAASRATTVSMLEEALLRMQAEAKQFRRGAMHLLLFFLALAATACGPQHADTHHDTVTTRRDARAERPTEKPRRIAYDPAGRRGDAVVFLAGWSPRGGDDNNDKRDAGHDCRDAHPSSRASKNGIFPRAESGEAAVPPVSITTTTTETSGDA